MVDIYRLLNRYVLSLRSYSANNIGGDRKAATGYWRSWTDHCFTSLEQILSEWREISSRLIPQLMW